MKRLVIGLIAVVALIALLPVGCGDSARSSTDAPANTDAPIGTATLTVTSTAFAEGSAIPVTHTCTDANTSPPLAWSGAPSATQSFAVVLTDLSLSPVLVHWVIYDIPATGTGLPADVENTYAPANVAGAHQTVSVHAPMIGYYGPCPPNMHSYQFAVYALDVTTLPGGSGQTTRAEALLSIVAHQLASGTLTGTYTP